MRKDQDGARRIAGADRLGYPQRLKVVRVPVSSQRDDPTAWPAKRGAACMPAWALMTR